MCEERGQLDETLDLTYFLDLLWENRAIDLSPPTCSVSFSGNSFSPGGKTHLLPPSTVLLQVTFGHPLLLFTFGAQVRAMHGFCWLSIGNTCPIQHHLHLLICSLMVQVLAHRLTSSFDTFIGQYIFNNLRRHLCRNVSSFASSLFVILQVSHP